MLKIENSNINFSGVSMVEEQRVATFSANNSMDSNVFFNYNIENRELYNTHITDVDNDFMAFKVQVLKSLDAMKQ